MSNISNYFNVILSGWLLAEWNTISCFLDLKSTLVAIGWNFIETQTCTLHISCSTLLLQNTQVVILSIPKYTNNSLKITPHFLHMLQTDISCAVKQ